MKKFFKFAIYLIIYRIKDQIVLFSTKMVTVIVMLGKRYILEQEYPKKVGVENLSEVSALTQLFWPIFRSPQEPKTEKV